MYNHVRCRHGDITLREIALLLTYGAVSGQFWCWTIKSVRSNPQYGMLWKQKKQLQAIMIPEIYIWLRVECAPNEAINYEPGVP